MDIKNLEIGFLSGFLGALIIGVFSLLAYSGISIVNKLFMFIIYGFLLGIMGLLVSIIAKDFKIYHAMIIGFLGTAAINTYVILNSAFFPISTFVNSLESLIFTSFITSGIEGLAFTSIVFVILDKVIKRR